MSSPHNGRLSPTSQATHRNRYLSWEVQSYLSSSNGWVWICWWKPPVHPDVVYFPKSSCLPWGSSCFLHYNLSQTWSMRWPWGLARCYCLMRPKDLCRDIATSKQSKWTGWEKTAEPRVLLFSPISIIPLFSLFYNIVLWMFGDSLKKRQCRG